MDIITVQRVQYTYHPNNNKNILVITKITALQNAARTADSDPVIIYKTQGHFPNLISIRPATLPEAQTLKNFHSLIYSKTKPLNQNAEHTVVSRQK